MKSYICPMHPDVQSDKPGTCPKCHMRLVHKEEVQMKTHTDNEKSYTPLIVIIALITLVTLVLTGADIMKNLFSLEKSMMYFMAGFFLVFSGFKLLDLKGFAEGYSTYDLLAQKVFGYGYVYPFLELFLGLAYVLGIRSVGLYAFTFLLMAFSGLGVAKAMLEKRTIQCACLGTFLKVPLTKITLVEDLGMALMALVMIVRS